MSGLRFKAGDMARVVVSRGPHSQLHINDVVQIETVGDGIRTDMDGLHFDYGTSCTCNTGRGEQGCSLMDWQLQPINPPPEPLSLTRTCDDEVCV